MRALFERGVDVVVKRFMRSMPQSSVKYLRLIPTLPRSTRRRQPWRTTPVQVPSALLTTPGIRRDPAAEREAFGSAPLHDFFVLHAQARPWVRSQIWRSFLPEAPRYLRAVRRVAKTPAGDGQRAAAPGVDEAELTRAVKARADELGISAIGIAAYDPKYTLVEHQDKQCGERVIVCVLEDDYDAAQTSPSTRAERGVYDTCTQLMNLALGLAAFVQRQGYRAKVHDVSGQTIAIHYGVEAGLGQLGLNGQLLTPIAGSRCRLLVISTDAPLEVGQPVDYGMTGICDACQACVERCPSGAIPLQRGMYRGVEKAKINTKRCWPVVARAEGCAVCMKVCPVQRYGLNAVVEEYERSGTILGRGTDELEGYDWPLDERHYGPGEKPRLGPGFFDIPGFDPKRTLPLVVER